MAGRNLVFLPLAGKRREAFLARYHQIAAAALDGFDSFLRASPDKGEEIAQKKGVFALGLTITVQNYAFAISALYSYNRTTIRVAAFIWKLLAYTPSH